MALNKGGEADVDTNRTPPSGKHSSFAVPALNNFSFSLQELESFRDAPIRLEGEWNHERQGRNIAKGKVEKQKKPVRSSVVVEDELPMHQLVAPVDPGAFVSVSSRDGSTSSGAADGPGHSGNESCTPEESVRFISSSTSGSQ